MFCVALIIALILIPVTPVFGMDAYSRLLEPHSVGLAGIALVLLVLAVCGGVGRIAQSSVPDGDADGQVVTLGNVPNVAKRDIAQRLAVIKADPSDDLQPEIWPVTIGRFIRDLEENNFKVQEYVFNSKERLIDALTAIGNNGGADVILIAAHASSRLMSAKQNPDRDEDVITIEYIELLPQLLREQGINPEDALVRGGSIVIFGCETGKGQQWMPNIANAWHRAFPQATHVFGSPAKAVSIRPFFDDTGRLCDVLYQKASVRRKKGYDAALVAQTQSRPGIVLGLKIRMTGLADPLEDLWDDLCLGLRCYFSFSWLKRLVGSFSGDIEQPLTEDYLRMLEGGSYATPERYPYPPGTDRIPKSGGCGGVRVSEKIGLARKLSSFQEAINWLDNNRTLAGEMIVVESMPEQDELNRIAQLSFETGIYHIKDTQRWLVVKGSMYGKNKEEGPGVFVYGAGDIYDVFIHTHPVGEWPSLIPSPEDVYLASIFSGDYFVLSQEGLTKFTGCDQKNKLIKDATRPGFRLSIMDSSGYTQEEYLLEKQLALAEMVMSSALYRYIILDRKEYPRSAAPIISWGNWWDVYLRFYKRVGADLKFIAWKDIPAIGIFGIEWDSISPLETFRGILPPEPVIIFEPKFAPRPLEAAIERKLNKNMERTAMELIRSIFQLSTSRGFPKDLKASATLMGLYVRLKAMDIDEYYRISPADTLKAYEKWKGHWFTRVFFIFKAKKFRAEEEKFMDFINKWHASLALEERVLSAIKQGIRCQASPNLITETILGFDGVISENFLIALGYSRSFKGKSLLIDEILHGLSLRIGQTIRDGFRPKGSPGIPSPEEIVGVGAAADKENSPLFDDPGTPTDEELGIVNSGGCKAGVGTGKANFAPGAKLIGRRLQTPLSACRQAGGTC
ncbi:MAG: hypothetical protein WCY12_07010, partial [Candidatus Omnitrophota bacterium]